MPHLPSWRWILDRVIRARRADRDLDAEVDAHLALEAQQRIEAGEGPADAWAGARRDFGSELLVKEITRELWHFTSIERIVQDLRYAVRSLRRSAGFTAVACAALALGIGATTALFTIVYSVLIRPLPFPDPDRLVIVSERPPHSDRPNLVSFANVQAWQQRNRVFESLDAFEMAPMNLMGGDEPVQVLGAAVTANFFRVLRVPPHLGRTFSPDASEPGATPTAILSYAFWQQRFGGRTDVIGHRVSINVRHHEVVGVMPPGFVFPSERVQVFVPLRASRNEGRNFTVVARLKPGLSLTTARDEMAAVAAQTAREDPDMNAGWGTVVVPLHEHTVSKVRRALLVLFAAVGFVLLIACANVANLVLMRSASRGREMSIRQALGAGRWRLLHQVLVESWVLSCAGGMLGTALAFASVRGFVTLLPPTFPLPRRHEIAIDPWVLLFTAAVVLLSAALFSVLPRLRSDGAALLGTLTQKSRTVASTHRRLRSVIVVAEIALALPLLCAAGLMAQSFVRLTHVEPGFRPEGVLTVRMVLLPVRNREHHAQFVDEVLQRVRALPQVVAAGSIGNLPMGGGNTGSFYYRADRPAPPLSARPSGHISIVSPGYFRAMDIPLLRGRDFDSRDGFRAPHVAMLNRAAARAFFGDENPLGKQIEVSWNDAGTVEIVGVVGDIRHSQLQTAPQPCLFLPNGQQPFPFTALVVRTLGDPKALAASVKEQIRQTDPDQGIAEARTMDEVVAGAVAQPKLQTMLLVVFSGVAVVLASIGIYGVLAYSVAQRTREIGVRLALGASPGSAFRMVVREGLGLTTLGVAIGLAATAAATGSLRGLLFETEPLDPAVVVTVTVILAGVAAIACSLPARRATRVDPALVLREE